ncbi:MAG TPA: phosphatidylserine decarboxylase family protein [Syntrophobacteraceae bacterium]|nr:phosphatidylserine decarboxylase family protein [Syntrophobacteraceae bacterium]
MNSGTFRDKSTHIPIAREGIPYVLAFAFTTLIVTILGYVFSAWILLVLTLLVGYFFRDPGRILTAEDRDVVSPADGKVILIERVDGTCFTQNPSIKISIFMSIFDVHVNRIPLSGTVYGVRYQKGGFRAAQTPKAGRENERNWVWIRGDAGTDVVLTQVAGLIARRIVCWPKAGERVFRGERFGMIRFGSRVDMYVPEESEILVSRGQHVYGGETVLCRLR